MNLYRSTGSLWLVAILAAGLTVPAFADEFTEDDLRRWQDQYTGVVKEGNRLFHGGFASENTVSCAQRHEHPP